MKRVIRLLIGSENHESVQSCIFESLEYLNGPGLGYEPPWPLKPYSDMSLEVHVHKASTMASLEEEINFSRPSLVLIESVWSRSDLVGLEIVQRLQKRHNNLPPLVIYTFQDAQENLAEAMRAGVHAVLRRQDHVHFLNLLFAIANKKPEIDTHSLVSHHIPTEIGIILDRLYMAKNAMVHATPEETVDYLTHGIQIAKRLQNLTQFWLQVVKVKQGIMLPKRISDELEMKDFVTRLTDLLNATWTLLSQEPVQGKPRPKKPVFEFEDFQECVGAKVLTDDDYLSAVVSELLRNVMKHGNGKETLQINVKNSLCGGKSKSCIYLSVWNQDVDDDIWEVYPMDGRIGLAGLRMASMAYNMPEPSFFSCPTGFKSSVAVGFVVNRHKQDDYQSKSSST